EIAQKIDNIELYRQLLEAQQEALRLVERNAALLEENVALKGQLRERDGRDQLQAELVFRDNALWRGEDETRAYCVHCWEAEHKLITVASSRHTHHCPHCDKRWSRPSAPPVPPRRATVPNPRMQRFREGW